MTFLCRFLCFMVRAYQLTLSPLMGGQCRFYPSCSAYALEALSLHGAAGGMKLAATRVLRCHPWNPGGVDPVPHPRGPHRDGPCPCGPGPSRPHPHERD